MLAAAGRFARSLAAAGALVVPAVACQPVESEVPPPAPVAGATGEEVPGGTGGLPGDIDSLLGRLASVAAEWQAGTAVAQLAISLDGEDWQEATVTYLAPDSDRMLLVRLDADGTSQQRPTFETLDLEPVAADGLAEVPPTADLLEPGVLIERAGEALEDCVAGDVASVLYSTGAPAAWDGGAWTEPPAWTATLGGDEHALVVDPVTAEASPGECLDAG